MSEPGSWPSGPQPGAYPPGPYQGAGQSPPYWSPTPPGSSPYPGAPFPGAQDRPATPPTGALVAVGISLCLSMLVGLSRWLVVYLNATSTDEFQQWPYRTWPVAVEVLLALAGFVGAAAVVSAPARRTPQTWGVLAAAAAVLGYALNDGLYQLLTIIV